VFIDDLVEGCVTSQPNVSVNHTKNDRLRRYPDNISNIPIIDNCV
jgi:hypothetical protein